MTRDEAIDKLMSLPGTDSAQRTMVAAIVDGLCVFNLITLDPPKTDITIRVSNADVAAVERLLLDQNMKIVKVSIVDQGRTR